MKHIIKSVLVLCLFLFSTKSYSQDQPGFECDNNFGECGTPEQSGGGGGGGRSVLVQATDLGDTYQNADDYDDDGIEDNTDNCVRDSNPNQLDSDGDGIGDMCDNCLRVYNPSQSDIDSNGRGNACDNYEEHDAYVYVSPCPDLGSYEVCGEDNFEATYENDFIRVSIEKESPDMFVDNQYIQEDGCNAYLVNAPVNLILAFLFLFRRKLSLR